MQGHVSRIKYRYKNRQSVSLLWFVFPFSRGRHVTGERSRPLAGTACSGMRKPKEKGRWSHPKKLSRCYRIMEARKDEDDPGKLLL